MSDEHIPHPSKSFLTNKIGPLPTWAWMAIGLGVAITISVVRGNMAGSAKKTTEDSAGTLSGGTTGESVQEIGGSQRPPVVTQLYNTSIFQPPMGGRTEPPSCAPPSCVPSSGPSCTTLPSNCAPRGQWVSLASSCGPARSTWQATLGGIARHFGLADLSAIWNAPENATLKQRRKDPKYLHAGDRVWVPACAPNGSPCPPTTEEPCPPGGGPSRAPRHREHSRDRR